MSGFTTTAFDQLHDLGLSQREMAAIETTFLDRENDYARTAERSGLGLRCRRSPRGFRWAAGSGYGAS